MTTSLPTAGQKQVCHKLSTYLLETVVFGCWQACYMLVSLNDQCDLHYSCRINNSTPIYYVMIHKIYIVRKHNNHESINTIACMHACLYKIQAYRSVLLTQAVHALTNLHESVLRLSSSSNPVQFVISLTDEIFCPFIRMLRKNISCTRSKNNHQNLQTQK